MQQSPFEVLHAFKKTDGQGIRAEAGAVIIRSSSMFLYPGRNIRISVEMKTKEVVAPFAQGNPHKLESVSGLIAKLPYEGTGKNAPCPCGSGLRFKSCCATPHEFSNQYIDDFERQYCLGAYDKKEYHLRGT